MLSHVASELTYKNDTGMYFASDEINFADPAVSQNPISFIEHIDAPVVALKGYELMQRGDLERKKVSNRKTILAQREFVSIKTARSKPRIICRLVWWCSGELEHINAKDSVRAMEELLNIGQDGIVKIVYGQSLSLSTIVDMLAEVLGQTAVSSYVPSPRPSDLGHVNIGNDKMMARLSWRPETDLHPQIKR